MNLKVIEIEGLIRMPSCYNTMPANIRIYNRICSENADFSDPSNADIFRSVIVSDDQMNVTVTMPDSSVWQVTYSSENHPFSSPVAVRNGTHQYRGDNWNPGSRAAAWLRALYNEAENTYAKVVK